MRLRIVKTLLHKEALRHAANRGGLALAGLLITASLLLAALNPAAEKENPATLIGGVHHCFIWYDADSDWVRHLRENLPAGMAGNIRFSQIPAEIESRQKLRYPVGVGGIEIRTLPTNTVGADLRVWVRYPDGDRGSLTPYENWFWRETQRFFHRAADQGLKEAGVRSTTVLPPLAVDEDNLWSHRRAYSELRDRYRTALGTSAGTLPALELTEDRISGGTLDLRAALATALVMFSLCFTCVYLMPSLTCEERERGLLLAQALSPATALEILVAKFLFYPSFGIFLATLLAGIHNPTVLTRPLFWLALGVLSVGTLGIGMTIACLTRTQRAASLGALCYMLAIALILLVCRQNNLEFLPTLALEYHAPHLLHAVLTDQIRADHWLNLAAGAVLSAGWAALAVVLFRRRGWQ